MTKVIGSFRHRFVFVKTRKTAGTSLEIALSKHCGPDDIITPISTEDELLRSASGGVLPQNFCGDPALEMQLRKAILARDFDAIEVARSSIPSSAFRNHMPAGELRSKLGDVTWDGSFSFAFDRHPYEKAVSYAYFHYRVGDFSAHLDRIVSDGRYRNWDLYADDAQPIVTKVYRYEELGSALKDISQRTGIDVSSRLPRTKHKFRLDHRPARQVLSSTQKERIRAICREEFTLHGYAP